MAFSFPAAAADRPHETSRRIWVRRVTLIAGGAASLGFDTVTTRRATAAGAVESNALFADSQGRPQWGRIIGIKAGLCGGSAVFEETHVFHAWKSPSADWTWTTINAGTAGFYTWTGWHNLQLNPKQ